MSLEEREKAVKIIKKALERAYGIQNEDKDDYAASYILNQLLRAGYLNSKTTVYVDEIKDELEKAVFKCKVEE